MPRRSSKETNEKQQRLFPNPPASAPRLKLKLLEHPIWTENKAKLIERYIFLFLMVTKHGTYIDGFAGPQRLNRPQLWAAKLVVNLEPQWLRHLYLFEKSRKSFRKLQDLKRRRADLPIDIFQGDFNKLVVGELLATQTIGQKEAVFCLLDQRTFECHWSTVKALAGYKTNGYKIELFYFFPHMWLDRALAGFKKTEALDQWWGDNTWKQWRRLEPETRKDFFLERFKRELGYQYALAWPIYRRKHGGNIMYYMIHATDHVDAPGLMGRAYNEALDPIKPAEQLNLIKESSILT